MNRDTKKFLDKMQRRFCFSAQVEAEEYFREHKAGQELEPLRQTVNARLAHRGRGRNIFAGIAAIATAGSLYALTEGAIDVVGIPAAVAFGALARRDHQRCIFWNMVGEQANAHGADWAQQVLRSAQRGEAKRVAVSPARS